jgi:hypothetical protein
MTRKGYSVLFAALLLVVQLLLGSVPGDVVTLAGAKHCAGCPDHASSGVVHTGTTGGGHDTPHCSGCAHDGSTGTGQSSCDVECALLGSGHCGSPATAALAGTTLINPADLAGSFGSDRRSVVLPDSPLFDLLRPPTRA